MMILSPVSFLASASAFDFSSLGNNISNSAFATPKPDDKSKQAPPCKISYGKLIEALEDSDCEGKTTLNLGETCNFNADGQWKFRVAEGREIFRSFTDENGEKTEIKLEEGSESKISSLECLLDGSMQLRLKAGTETNHHPKAYFNLDGEPSDGEIFKGEVKEELPAAPLEEAPLEEAVSSSDEPQVEVGQQDPADDSNTTEEDEEEEDGAVIEDEEEENNDDEDEDDDILGANEDSLKVPQEDAVDFESTDKPTMDLETLIENDIPQSDGSQQALNDNDDDVVYENEDNEEKPSGDGVTESRSYLTSTFWITVSIAAAALIASSVGLYVATHPSKTTTETDMEYEDENEVEVGAQEDEQQPLAEEPAKDEQQPIVVEPAAPLEPAAMSSGFPSTPVRPMKSVKPDLSNGSSMSWSLSSAMILLFALF